MNLTIASKQWAHRPNDERFENLKDLKEAVLQRKNNSTSSHVQVKKLSVNPFEGGFIVNSAIFPSLPSNWAFSQLCNRLGAPAGYLRTLPAHMVAGILNYHLKESEDFSAFLVYKEAESQIGELRAVTSTSYGRIWDVQVVEAAERLVERSNGRFFNPKEWSGKPSGLYASDHDVFIFLINGGSIVDGGTERDQMYRGVIMWNSEVGSATFGLMTFLFRWVCGNHIIWGASNINNLLIRHTKGAPERFVGEVWPTIQGYLNQSSSLEEAKIKKLRNRLLPLKEEYIVEAYQPRFTKSELEAAIGYAKREEGDCRTVWQLINGLTAEARDLPFADQRVNLERRVGELIEVS